MADIDVQDTDAGEFVVTVNDGAGTSRHTVTVPEGYLEQLGVAGASPENVVRVSFSFLLERESKEQIMGSFDLPVIERYFPEYPEELPGLLRS